jgi:hypothetical protein
MLTYLVLTILHSVSQRKCRCSQDRFSFDPNQRSRGPSWRRSCTTTYHARSSRYLRSSGRSNLCTSGRFASWTEYCLWRRLNTEIKTVTSWIQNKSKPWKEKSASRPAMRLERALLMLRAMRFLNQRGQVSLLPILTWKVSTLRLLVNQSRNLKMRQSPKRKFALMRARRRVLQSQIRVLRSPQVRATRQLPHKMVFSFVCAGDGVGYGYFGGEG